MVLNFGKLLVAVAFSSLPLAGDDIASEEKLLDFSELQNWSMDLISSLPHQSQEMWEESLRCAISARPTHVSVYDLQVEQGTKFGHL